MPPVPNFTSHLHTPSKQQDDHALKERISASVDELLASEWAAMKAIKSPREAEDSGAPSPPFMGHDIEQQTPETDIPEDHAMELSILEIELAFQQVIALGVSSFSSDGRQCNDDLHSSKPRRRISQEALLRLQAPVFGSEGAAKGPKYRSLCGYELPEGDRRQVWDTDFLRLAFGEIEEVDYGDGIREAGVQREGRATKVTTW